MATTDRVGERVGGDAVEQARSWLAERAGSGAEDDPVADRAGPARPDRSPGAVGPAGRTDLDDPDADHEAVARTIALRRLAAQARTRHELDQALHKKNVPDAVAAAVLDRLEEVGLLDDEAYARDWVASRQQRRHLSRSALRRELQHKGVDRAHVDSALAAVAPGDELAAARALATKKAAGMRGLDPEVRHRRLAGALARRGFGSGIITSVLSELRAEQADEAGA